MGFDWSQVVTEDIWRLYPKVFKNRIYDVENKEYIPFKLNVTQQEGVKALLKNKTFGIFDEVGVGKSVQIITSSLIRDQKRNEEYNIFYFTTKSVVEQAMKEWEKFTELKINKSIFQIKGNLESRVGLYDAIAKDPSKFKVIIGTSAIVKEDTYNIDDETFPLLYKYFKKLKDKGRSIILVLDEASAVKNNESIIHQCFKKIYSMADVKIAATATPIMNNVLEWYNLFSCMGYEPITIEQLKENHLKIIKIKLNKYVTVDKIVEYRNVEQLIALYDGYYVSRKKENDSVLHFYERRCEYSEFEYERYKSTIVEKAIEYKEKLIENVIHKFKNKKPPIAISKNYAEKIIEDNLYLNKYKLAIISQAILSSSLLKDRDDKFIFNSKEKILLELVKEIISKNERCVIFTQFKQITERLKEILLENGVNADVFHGDHSSKKREQKKVDFNNYKTDVLIFTTSGSMGLNLPTCPNMIFYTITPSYGIWLQTIGRIDRANSKYRDKKFYFINNTKGIDRYIYDLFELKQLIFEKILPTKVSAKFESGGTIKKLFNMMMKENPGLIFNRSQQISDD